MTVTQGPPLPKRTKTDKAREELRLLRRDGPIKYWRCLRALRQFRRSCRLLTLDDDD